MEGGGRLIIKVNKWLSIQFVKVLLIYARIDRGNVSMKKNGVFGVRYFFQEATALIAIAMFLGMLMIWASIR